MNKYKVVSWALKIQGLKSSAKFLLVCLASYSDKDGHCSASLAQMVIDTCQDRKTVLGNVKLLSKLGLIADTGIRAGVTKQVTVYRINIGQGGSVAYADTNGHYEAKRSTGTHALLARYSRQWLKWSMQEEALAAEKNKRRARRAPR